MRKAMLFAPMLMLLLTACGGGGEKDPAAELQTQYASLASASMEAEVICHYGDEVRQYRLLCKYGPEASTVTVLAPEDVAGISAGVEDGELVLRYEDISLDAGSYAADAVSPMAVLPRLMEAAAEGYPVQQGEEPVGERACLRLSCDLDGQEDTLYTTWFDCGTLLPLRSEVVMDGTLVFEVSWLQFTAGERVPEHTGETAPPQDIV